MKRATKIMLFLFFLLLTGSVFINPPLAQADFTLELDASYDGGALSLVYTVGTLEEATWANFLILTLPTVQVIPLWTISLPVIDPPISLPIAFPFPQIGWIIILTELVTAEGVQLVEVAFVPTSCWDDDGDGYEDDTCGGDDCDDSNPEVNPGGTEGPLGDTTCSDGLDNDCDEAVDEADLDCDAGEMVTIPAGGFVMGSDPGEGAADEMPEHVVWLSGYDIDRYAVTNIEFADFLNDYGSNISPEGYEMLDADDPDRHIYWDGISWYTEPGYWEHPVIEVTWYGASTFCAYYGKRLPTEAEFEKAARGGCEVGGAPGICEDPDDERTYPWGEGIDCDHANYSGCVGDTTPVGSYPLGLSPYGAYDMAGNVWEWVYDWYELGYYDYSPYQDPQGPASGTNRALHGGGSWIDGTYGMRVARRWPYNPISSGYNVGFRCARDYLCWDDDGDGYDDEVCGGDDCDDTEASVNPGMEESAAMGTCADGKDNDCDGAVDGADSHCEPFISFLPDTGIELCFGWSHEIDCPAPGEPYYGQDAQYVINPMNFSNNYDGTVTDNVTGLMWQQEDDDVQRIWSVALAYCESLDLAGHTDWRLPDEYELQGIVDYGPSMPSIDTTYFPGTDSSEYWSSSIYAYNMGLAWYVDFRNGTVNWNSGSYDGYVRCVRGEIATQSFTDQGNGTVTDNVTGLKWQQEDDDVGKNWEEALAYCETLTLAGHTDWRLPDSKELRSIVDNTRWGPSIDTTYFPGTNSSIYWSSSTYTYASLTQGALSVTFFHGYVGSYSKTYSMFVRCVR